MRDDRARLSDILEAIEYIEKYSARGRGAFDSDELIQTWIIHYLRILGEAARTLSAEFRQAHPEIPWPKIIGQRHVLVHHYFRVDTEIVWSVIETELPDLKAKVQAALESGIGKP